MRSRIIRRMLLVLSVLTLVSGIAGAETEYEYIPATEQVYLGIGCQTTAATCDSTSYWLGKTAGDSSVANTGNATPLSWLFRQLGEPSEYARFVPDETLAPSYALRTDEPISGAITVGGYAGGGELAADSNLRVVLEGVREDTQEYLVLGDVTVNKPVVTPSAATPDSVVYEFSMPIDPELEKVAVSDLTLVLYQDSATVLQNGFVDGEGASSFKLPYYDVQPVEPVVEEGTTTP